MADNIMILPKIDHEFHKELIDNSGLQGNVYRYSDTLVYKEYKTDSFNLPQLELLTNQKSKLIAYPKILVFEKEYSKKCFRGYLSDFIEGKVIYNLDGRLLLNEFINALEEFEKEVINVSRRGIVMHDMHQENIILTPNNSLVAIDTDMFEVTYDDEIWVLRNNMKELGETIISELVTLAKLESEKLNNLINDCGAYGRIKPSNLLREFICYFEQRMFKTETVSDFKNGVQLIKKR